jgi:outer membrane immunogenic protein
MRRLLISALVSGGVVIFGQASAGDIEVSPSRQAIEFQRRIVDWQGGYAGFSLALDKFEASIDSFAQPVDVVDGDGSLAGFIGGYTWRHGPLLFGIEADLGFGFADLDGHEDERALLATLRPRVGYDFGTAFPYVTAGMAFAGLTLEGTPSDYDELDYAAGGLVGVGLETAFARRLSGRIEYLYGRFWDTDLGEDVKLDLDSFHVIRAGLIYHWDAY